MKKTELIDAVADRTEGRRGDPLTRSDVEKVMEATLDVISDELARGGEVQVTGFGTFKTSMRTPRDPSSGEILPERRVPTFKAGAKLKESVR